ncbi:MAG: hypothetical protein ACJ8BW_31190 [Ktedonobacteraceae bacterium]
MKCGCRLPIGFWPGLGGVVATKVVPAITTRNVVSRLADPGWLSEHGS